MSTLSERLRQYAESLIHASGDNQWAAASKEIGRQLLLYLDADALEAADDTPFAWWRIVNGIAHAWVGKNPPDEEWIYSPLYRKPVAAVWDYEQHNCYYELIMAVEQKHPGETRHQTALRHIKERERGSSEGQMNEAKCAAPPADGGKG